MSPRYFIKLLLFSLVVSFSTIISLSWINWIFSSSSHSDVKPSYNFQYWEIVRKSKSNYFPDLDILPQKYTRPYPINNLWRSKMKLNLDENMADESSNNRALGQLIWQMDYASYIKPEGPLKMKRLLLWEGFNFWTKGKWSSELKAGFKQLKESDCPGTPNSITQCIFTEDRSNLEFGLDAVLAERRRSSKSQSLIRVPNGTMKYYYSNEPPFKSAAVLRSTQELLVSYWKGADVITPYGQWIYYNPQIKSKDQNVNYSEGKSKPVAIFMSNCFADNQRNAYLMELLNYIQVDIYGKCGSLSCPRTNETNCFDLLKKDYFFYLAFENSNCRDYITEKFFLNGLQSEVIPVVMGAHPIDYQSVAPLNSYIHIDEFLGPKQLAEYLHFLIKNPSEYNKYFKWKGTGQFIREDVLCRICAMVHYSDFVAPPIRDSPLRWNSKGAYEHGLCLNKKQTYWTNKHENQTVTTFK